MRNLGVLLIAIWSCASEPVDDESGSVCVLDCALDCARDGRCTLDAVSCSCRATNQADCQASEVCFYSAACTFDGTACVLRFDSDCARSGICSVEGRCWLGPEGYCIGRHETACKVSQACWESGCCGLTTGGWCDIPNQDSCTASLVCQDFGACTFMVNNGNYACCDETLCYLCNRPGTPSWPSLSPSSL
jgi:hypothetical protein